jgi:hypothetical protein
MAMTKDSGDRYSAKEAAERFVAAPRGSRATGHKPMTDIPKKRATKKTAPKKKLGK